MDPLPTPKKTYSRSYQNKRDNAWLCQFKVGGNDRFYVHRTFRKVVLLNFSQDNGAARKSSKTVTPSVAAPVITCVLVICGDFSESTVKTPRQNCPIKSALSIQIVLMIILSVIRSRNATTSSKTTVTVIKSAPARCTKWVITCAILTVGRSCSKRQSLICCNIAPLNGGNQYPPIAGKSGIANPEPVWRMSAPKISWR